MNEIAVSSPIGRPLKFKSVEEMQSAIDTYFADCEANDEPLTVTGLCIALDTSRETLLDYQGKDEYSYTIKKAKLMCENYAEKQLFKGKNVIGVIFNLKNNYGWKDQQSIDLRATARQEYQSMTDEELEETLIAEVIQKRPDVVARLKQENT